MTRTHTTKAQCSPVAPVEYYCVFAQGDPRWVGESLDEALALARAIPYARIWAKRGERLVQVHTQEEERVMRIEATDGVASATLYVARTCDVERVVADWVRDGEWGPDGGEVEVSWALYEGDDDGDALMEGVVIVDIARDERAQILDACLAARVPRGERERVLGCTHEWEHAGAIGVGSDVVTDEVCAKCGLRRRTITSASGRAVSYRAPEEE